MAYLGRFLEPKMPKKSGKLLLPLLCRQDKAQAVPLTHIQTEEVEVEVVVGVFHQETSNPVLLAISNHPGFQGLESLLISLCSPVPNNCSPPLPAPPCHFLAALGTEGFLLLH